MSALAPQDLAALPVFPLPRVVLLPRQSLPLHVFEPRYRAMMADCLSRGPRAMAVALLRDGWERDYEGRPPIHEVAGAGVIELHRANADGTYDLLLACVARVRLDELPDDGLPYRRARATVLDDVAPPGGVDTGDVAALFATASAIATAVRRAHPQFELGVGADADAAQLADVVAQRLVPDAATRQRILETTDVGERVRLVTQAIGELLARAAPRGSA